MASQIDASKPANNGSLVSEEIRDNFVAAKTEIEALQSDVSGITPASIGAQAELQSGTNIKTLNSISLLGGGNIPLEKFEILSGVTINCGANINYFYKEFTANTELSVSNVPSCFSFILETQNAGSFLVTWWSGVTWQQGIAPLLSTGRDVSA